MRLLSTCSAFILATLPAFAQSAPITPYWDAVNVTPNFSDPVKACFESHQSFSVNDGILPNQFIRNYDAQGKLIGVGCLWNKGSPGYWGTAGNSFRDCPNSQDQSDEGVEQCVDQQNFDSMPTCGGEIEAPVGPQIISSGPMNSDAGNPIDILSGFKRNVELDFSVGRGRLFFSRFYSSGGFDTPNGMGRIWASNLNPVVKSKHNSGGGFFAYTDPNGKTLRFNQENMNYGGEWRQATILDNGQKWYASDWGNRWRNDQLGYSISEPVPEGEELILKDPMGVERVFHLLNDGGTRYDPILKTIRYPDGYEIDITHNADRMPITATDTDGYSIQLSYNSAGLLDEVTAPDGSIYGLKYELMSDGAWAAGISSNMGNIWEYYSMLTEVIYPDDTPSDDTDNPRKQYHYDHADNPVALTSITDERGIVIRTWDYEFNAATGWRAISSVGPNGTENTTITETVSNEEYTVTNALGKETDYEFDVVHFMPKLKKIDGVASASCAASNRSVGYDTFGNITSLVDAEGQTESRSVNLSTGLLNSVTLGSGSPDSVTTTYTWDTTLRKPTKIVSPGITADIVYNSDWLPTSLTLTDTTSHSTPYSTNGQQRAVAYTWTGEGLLQSIDGPLSGSSDTISFTYDTNGNLASVSDEVGHVTTINSVDAMGRPTQMTDPNGVVTSMTYSPRGWVEQISQSSGGSTRVTDLTYDLAGNLTKIDFPNGGSLSYTYNDSSWLTKVSSSAGDEITYQHDLLGNITSANFQPTGGGSLASFSMQYDELGRLTQRLGGAGDLMSYAYDRADRLTSMTDGTSQPWLTGFDALNRVVSETDPELHSIQYDWTDQSELETYTDGRNFSTQFTRNGVGEVIREVSPDRGTTDYWYDSAGRMTRMLDAEGDDVTYAYDAAGRVINESYPNQAALNVSYTYDSLAGGNSGKGRLTGVSSAASGYTFAYNAYGELTSQVSSIGAQSYTLSQAFNGSGELTQVTLPSGRNVTYTHDIDSRVTSVSTTAAGGGATQTVVNNVGYAPFGPMTGYSFGNGASATFGHDGSYRLSSLSVSGTGPSLISKSYQYDGNNRVTAITDSLTNANSATYSYAADGRLASAVGPWGDYAWTYDPVGNRLTDTRYVSGALTADDDYTYSTSNNRLLSVSDSSSVVTRMISYTADGNINTDIQTWQPSRDYDYNDDGRLSQVSIGGSPVATYDYDAFEHRVRRFAGGVERHFVFSPNGMLIGEYEGSTGNVVTEYIWLNDRLVGTVDGSGTLSYVQTGHLGQPLLVMDGAGAATWQGETTPFGVFVATAGSASDPELMFPGQWLESGSGLFHNWHRDYDPTLGRYIEADPLGIAAGQSVYGYTEQSPLNWVDSDGLHRRPARRPGMGHNGGPSMYSPNGGGPVNRRRGQALNNWLGSHAPNMNPNLPEAGAKTPRFSQDHNDYMQRLANHAYNQATENGTMCTTFPPPPGYSPAPSVLGGPIFVDSAGNAFPAPPGGSLGSSPDGRWMSVKDANGQQIGIRKDNGHPAGPRHPDVRGQQPHGHQPGRTNPDGTPWLPIRD